MSYNFGQLRRSQIESFLIPMEYTIESIEKQSEISNGDSFTDIAIVLTKDIFQAIGSDNKKKSYFLKMKIFKRMDSEQVVNIKFINTNKDTDNSQFIKTVIVPKGDISDYSVIEIVMTPNDIHSYNEIVLELEREKIDYDIGPGRTMAISVSNLAEIHNVIDDLNLNINNQGFLKQIAIQGPTGLLMSINGEEIRIGRTKIYEIEKLINIDFLGFIILNEEDNFILDYQY